MTAQIETVEFRRRMAVTASIGDGTLHGRFVAGEGLDTLVGDIGNDTLIALQGSYDVLSGDNTDGTGGNYNDYAQADCFDGAWFDKLFGIEQTNFNG